MSLAEELLADLEDDEAEVEEEEDDVAGENVLDTIKEEDEDEDMEVGEGGGGVDSADVKPKVKAEKRKRLSIVIMLFTAIVMILGKKKSILQLKPRVPHQRFIRWEDKSRWCHQ